MNREITTQDDTLLWQHSFLKNVLPRVILPTKKNDRQWKPIPPLWCSNRATKRV